MVRAQLALGDGDLIGLEEARPIDVGIFEVRATDALNRLGTIEQLKARIISEVAGANKDAAGKAVLLRGCQKGINLALRNGRVAAKELALNRSKGWVYLIC